PPATTLSTAAVCILVLSSLIHFAPKFFVFLLPFIVEKRPNLCSRCLADRIDFWLVFCAQLSGLPAAVLADFAHLFPLRQIQAQVVIELVDIALCALDARTRGVGGTGHTSGVEIGD